MGHYWISIIKKLASSLRPKDFLEAIGPMCIVGLFGYVLYAINSNQDAVVQMNLGLIFWPLYQFIGFLTENSLMNFLIAKKTKKDDDYMMAVGSLLLLIGLMSALNYSNWVLIIVAAQLLPLMFHPVESWNQEKGCVNALIKSFLLFTILISVFLGLHELLSEPYELPYAEGGFKFLPGMIIIGIAYYCLSAILDVLMQPLMRGAAMYKGFDETHT